MGKSKDIIGKIYGNLTVKELSHTKDYKKYFVCLCSCGKEKTVAMTHLVTGHTKSCGCLNTHQGNTKHKLSKTSIYKRYYAMIDRCHNPKCISYAKYGALGITVCDEWKNSFMAFKSWAENNGYSEDLTIDRKNTNLGYTPENCRWVNYSVQGTNQKKSIRNTSGIRGVFYNTKKERWIGRVTVLGKRIETGSHTVFEEAVKLYMTYLIKHDLQDHLRNISDDYK